MDVLSLLSRPALCTHEKAIKHATALLSCAKNVETTFLNQIHTSKKVAAATAALIAYCAKHAQ